MTYPIRLLGSEAAAAPVAHTATHAEPTAPCVSGVLLRALADVVLQYGVTPSMLLQHDTKRFISRDPVDVRVPLAEFRALLDRAIALTRDPAIGLQCALR